MDASGAGQRLQGSRGTGVGLAIGVALLCAFAGAARAQGPPLPITGELPVNQTVAGSQHAPEVGMRDNGTYVVVWRGDVQGSGLDIFSRRFPGDGTAPFNESVLNQVTTGDQFAPAIDVNGSGDWIALWTSDQAGQGLRARKTASGGTVLGNEFLHSTTTAGSFGSTNASRAEDGSWVGVWFQSAPKARRFDAGGTAVTGEVSVGTGLTSRSSASVATVADGGFWIAVTANDADLKGIYRERFDDQGLPLGAPELVAESTDNSQTLSDIDAAADGSFVITWTDSLLGSRVRCFAADGAPRSAEIGLDATGGETRVAVAKDGAFVAAWTTSGPVAAREFDRACRPVGDAFDVPETFISSQQGVDVATSADRFVVVWQGQGAGGDTDNLGVARRLFLRRSIFADPFESANTAAWSAVAP